MRISTREDDSGYCRRPWEHLIYCNGSLVTECFTADEGKGEAHRFVTNDDGKFMLSDDGQEVRTETLKGKVIIMPNNTET